jgi:sulfur-carrier protein
MPGRASAAYLCRRVRVAARTSWPRVLDYRVAIPSPLRSYCAGAAMVTIFCAVETPTLGDVLAALESAHPGIRFRMQDEQGRLRPHIKVFVDADVERNLAARVPGGAGIMIVAALSGG